MNIDFWKWYNERTRWKPYTTSDCCKNDRNYTTVLRTLSRIRKDKKTLLSRHAIYWDERH